MSSPVVEHVHLTKQALFDRSGPGLISQSGGIVIDESFAMPSLAGLTDTLPSIEMFVVSTSSGISAMGSNDALNAAWLPAVELLAERVRSFVVDTGITVAGDAYVTASITPAEDVNGEAHFDDDQFDAKAGAGFVAIVGDLDGPKVASGPIPHDEVVAPRPVVADDEMVEAFGNGTIPSNSFGANQLVALPQFGQLHAGPGPCGDADEVRHLLVYRVATTAR